MLLIEYRPFAQQVSPPQNVRGNSDLSSSQHKPNNYTADHNTSSSPRHRSNLSPPRLCKCVVPPFLRPLPTPSSATRPIPLYLMESALSPSTLWSSTKLILAHRACPNLSYELDAPSSSGMPLSALPSPFLSPVSTPTPSPQSNRTTL